MESEKKKWVSNATFGTDTDDGFNRCACGSTRFTMGCHSYEDGTRGYMLCCRECGRSAEADGSKDDLVKAWNELNDGASRVSFKVVSVPETIEVYVKPGEDAWRAAREELARKSSIKKA